MPSVYAALGNGDCPLFSLLKLPNCDADTNANLVPDINVEILLCTKSWLSQKIYWLLPINFWCKFELNLNLIWSTNHCLNFFETILMVITKVFSGQPGLRIHGVRHYWKGRVFSLWRHERYWCHSEATDLRFQPPLQFGESQGTQRKYLPATRDSLQLWKNGLLGQIRPELQGCQHFTGKFDQIYGKVPKKNHSECL